MVEMLTELAGYLRGRGYAVSVSEVKRAAGLLYGSGIREMETEQAGALLCPVFAKNPDQYLMFPEVFRDFFLHREEIREEADRREALGLARKKKQQSESEYEKARQDLSGRLAALEERAGKKREALEQEFAGKSFDVLSANDRKLLQKYEKQIGEDPLLRQVFQDQTVSPDDCGRAMEILKKQSGTALLLNDTEMFRGCTGLYRIAKKLQGSQKRRDKEMEKYVTDHLGKEGEELRNLRSALARQQADHDAVQRKIDEELDRLTQELRIKGESRSSRETFVGKNAVLQTDEVPSCARVPFGSLSGEQRVQITEYIRRNMLWFRTRLTRNLAMQEEGLPDLHETVHQACRTGGVPLKLCRNRKRPGKADLILVLDVSGSCRNASELMMTFLYYLQQAFPNGCLAFAFVNSLYNISDVLRTDSIGEALDAAFRLIPTRGVYSNYTVPFRSLWEEHREIFTPESMVIFIGDARNNGNPSFENELRNITGRVRRSYWLNTEPREKWDHNDSVASACAGYAEMWEITTPAALVDFLNSGLGRRRPQEVLV